MMEDRCKVMEGRYKVIAGHCKVIKGHCNVMEDHYRVIAGNCKVIARHCRVLMVSLQGDCMSLQDCKFDQLVDLPKKESLIFVVQAFGYELCNFADEGVISCKVASRVAK